MIPRYKFASGAEEKVIRTFEAPANFFENFQRICGVSIDGAEIKEAKGASVPSLGLSNKAVYKTNNINDIKIDSKNPYPEESQFTAVELSGTVINLTFFSSRLVNVNFRAANRRDTSTKHALAGNAKTIRAWLRNFFASRFS